MPLPPIHGVIPILVTPFDERGRIDPESLSALVDFTIDAGVHALGIALGSEVYKFTEAERELVITTVIGQVSGRVPVVVNTGAPATDLAVLFSRQAEEWGASAVMCTPPGVGFSAGELTDYFRSISDAVSVPVIIQDTNTTPVSAGLIRSLGEACERVRYAKVESSPQQVKVYEAVQACGDSVAIIGGAAGQFLIEELRRGAIGTMPWPSLPEEFVAVWNLWQAGEQTSARETFDRSIFPLLRVPAFSMGAGHHIHKYVLHRRGIIASPFVRPPAEGLDPISQQELEEACELLGF